jgi:hypothetical protein
MTYPFRFDADAHEYIDLATGRVLPHITGMLERDGLADDVWFTEESSVRGQMIHRLTADYDLGAIDVASCNSGYRGYLLAHIKALQTMQVEVLSVEEPLVYPPPKMFGGRPDRRVRIGGVLGVWEVKSGDPQKGHAIQTALQAILVAANDGGLPAEQLARWACYVKANGRFKIVEHRQRRDFDRAWRIIERWA